jgi:hypothetical protein
VFPEFPVVPVSPSLPLPPTLETHLPFSVMSTGNISVTFTVDSVNSAAP